MKTHSLPGFVAGTIPARACRYNVDSLTRSSFIASATPQVSRLLGLALI